MASINKFVVDGYECHKLVDTSTGRRLQYSVKLDKFTAKQWLAAHDDVMRSLSPEERQTLTNIMLKQAVLAWLFTPREGKINAKQTGIKIKSIEAKGEVSIKKVIESYLSDYCQPKINSLNAIDRVQRQCRIMLSFFEVNKIYYYSQLKRDIIKKYPEWRGRNSKGGFAAADTVNQELRRLKVAIRHGVKYCGWQERYLLDGIRVKPTPENTKSVRPSRLRRLRLYWHGLPATGICICTTRLCFPFVREWRQRLLRFCSRSDSKWIWAYCVFTTNWLVAFWMLKRRTGLGIFR